MRVLVTGATGFVGSHLAERLLSAGHGVTALVRSRVKASRVLDPAVRLIDGDLGDAEALRAGTRDQDAVFHVAGLVAARDEREYMKANRDGTQELVRAVERAGRPRFVLVSSLAAAGPSHPGRPLAGHEAPAPVTAYGRSKLAAEEVVRRSSLEWTIVRPPMVYGPRDTEVLKVFRVARGGVVPVFGSRRQELSAVYGPDLAEALLSVAVTPRTVGRTYYAAHAETFTSETFARIAAAAQGRHRALVFALPAGLTRALLAATGAAAGVAGRATLLNRDKANELLQAAWTCDPGPLSRDTGWRAAHDLRRGVAATVAWCRERGLL